MFIHPYLISDFFYCKNRCYIQKNKLATSKHLNLSIGKLYDEDLKKIKFRDFELDEIDIQNKTIYEYKKSCSNKKGSKFQLLYYLYLTRNIYINFKGCLKCIEDNSKEYVFINKKNLEELLTIINLIKNLNFFDISLINNKKCDKCGLYDYCHS